MDIGLNRFVAEVKGSVLFIGEMCPRGHRLRCTDTLECAECANPGIFTPKERGYARAQPREEDTMGVYTLGPVDVGPLAECFSYGAYVTLAAQESDDLAFPEPPDQIFADPLLTPYAR